ncbi:MAG: hypothetical protein ABIH57_03130 [Candidatus Omnitrophota bacterium]
MRVDSPEDRLLRLIKGKHKKKDDSAGQQEQGRNKSFLKGATKKFFLKNKIFKPSFLKIINRILVIVFIAALIYFVDIFFFNSHKDAVLRIFDGGIPYVKDDSTVEDESLAPKKESFSSFLKDIQGKELFTAPFLKGEKTSPKEVIDISKRFILVGIITGDEPQAIIEDTKTEKTHYLYKGQSVSGVTIKEISTGRVVLEYEGEEFALVL